jgi:hypothetical protein
MSTQNRELLELAAKSINLNVGTDCGMYDDLKWWNPLLNNNNAFHLAIYHRLQITHHENYNSQDDCVEVRSKDYSSIQYYNSDPLHATRRAITEVAAAIGEKEL